MLRRASDSEAQCLERLWSVIKKMILKAKREKNKDASKSTKGTEFRSKEKRKIKHTVNTYIFFISIKDDSLLDTYIINETPQDASPSSVTKRLVDRLGFSSHQTSGTETADMNNNYREHELNSASVLRYITVYSKTFQRGNFHFWIGKWLFIGDSMLVD